MPNRRGKGRRRRGEGTTFSCSIFGPEARRRRGDFGMSAPQILTGSSLGPRGLPLMERLRVKAMGNASGADSKVRWKCGANYDERSRGIEGLEGSRSDVLVDLGSAGELAPLLDEIRGTRSGNTWFGRGRVGQGCGSPVLWIRKPVDKGSSKLFIRPMSHFSKGPIARRGNAGGLPLRATSMCWWRFPKPCIRSKYAAL